MTETDMPGVPSGLGPGWAARLAGQGWFHRLCARVPGLRQVARAEGAALFEVVSGFVRSQALLALVELRVLHRLAEGAADTATLARETGLPEARMQVLAQAGAGLKLMKLRRGQWQLTTRGAAKAARVARVDPGMGAEGALLALAATARHALAGFNTALPDLIIGHGTLGRLLARLTLAAGGKPPTVWEIDPDRRSGATGYPVIAPEDDPRRDYRAIYDASGAKGLLDQLVMRLQKGGEVVLAGFYTEPVAFAFPPAFMKEARIRIASEWAPEDLTATRALIESGALSLAGLITHIRPATRAADAYQTAFTDAGCLKMILDWKGQA